MEKLLSSVAQKLEIRYTEDRLKYADQITLLFGKDYSQDSKTQKILSTIFSSELVWKKAEKLNDNPLILEFFVQKPLGVSVLVRSLAKEFKISGWDVELLRIDQGKATVICFD